MAKAIQKISSLGTRRDVPFNKLVLSQANVRRVKQGVSIDTLAESIARRGLLQNLNVRPVLDEGGAETGTYKVPAGGRRFRALELLVKAKRLEKTFPIPCNVRDVGSAISEEEDSLAENTDRENLDPIDEYRAFRTMIDHHGMSIEQVAAVYAVSPATVRQRLRLADVSPALIDLYATGEVTLDQLMAFSVTLDHARQEQVWATLARAAYREPYQIRRMLTEGAVRATDRRVLFVGVAAYEAAGGVLLRDLFSQDDGGWLHDAVLLDTLALAKLRAIAQPLADEGWRWIEVAIDFPYGHADGLRRVLPNGPSLSEQEQSAYDALQAEYRAIEQRRGDTSDDRLDDPSRRLGEIEEALDAFRARAPSFAPDDIARAGVFISLDRLGEVRIERGFVKPDDEAPIASGSGIASEADVETTSDGATASARGEQAITGAYDPFNTEGAEEDGRARPLPERLVQELTAHRTLALRDAVGRNPYVAMTVLLQKLVGDLFAHLGTAGPLLEVAVRPVHFPVQPNGLNDSVSATSVEERHAAWATMIPRGDHALWDWLETLDDAARLALLAHCVSYGVNALHDKVDRYGGAGLSQHGLDRRLAQADRLARAVGLDMVEAGWTATVDAYLGRVTKDRILEAVREAKGDQAAHLIGHLKKDDMAREAERLLAGTGWIPAPLRTPGDDELAQPTALPAFLIAEQIPSGTSDEPVHAVAE